MDAMKQLYFILITLLFLIFLPACTPMDAASTSIQAIYNRYSLQKNLNDQYISMMAARKIYTENDRYKNTNISVATFNNEVLITGEVANQKQRQEIEQIVRSIADIKKLYNLTIIASPSSTITRMSDSWITAKIKTQLLAMNDIEPGKIKVVTENGTVYLMGIVFPEQADTAIEIARTTEGVQNVVKIFSYLRISPH